MQYYCATRCSDTGLCLLSSLWSYRRPLIWLRSGFCDLKYHKHRSVSLAALSPRRVNPPHLCIETARSHRGEQTWAHPDLQTPLLLSVVLQGWVGTFVGETFCFRDLQSICSGITCERFLVQLLLLIFVLRRCLKMSLSGFAGAMLAGFLGGSHVLESHNFLRHVFQHLLCSARAVSAAVMVLALK